jgi:hypothetical protein
MSYRQPKRNFENSGTVNPQSSYYVALEHVVNSDGHPIATMVDHGRYFSIFAPRQSGKTTFLEGIRSQLHRHTTYIVILLNFQNLKEVGKKQFYGELQRELYAQLRQRLREVACEKGEEVDHFLKSHRLTDHLSFMHLFEALNRIIQSKKIVVFIDEFDGMPLPELENFLTTLRSLYQKYKSVKQKALYSIGLIGIRNITKLIVGGVSPFNIADQVEFPPFSLKNVRDLYDQYTDETNQPFTPGAVGRVHEETAGQPWLVNRLGTILTVDVKPRTSEPIDESDVDQAIQLLLRERNAHFDNLYEKAKLYKEGFIQIVFDHVEYNPDDEDQAYLEQYGLIKNRDGKAAVANPIYRARYTKTFFSEAEISGQVAISEYALPGSRLDMEKVLLDFEQYITQIGVQAFYKEKKPYEKTGQFLLTAWLYQFASRGEGDLRYEIRTGLGRMDVILTHRGKKYIVETKVNRYDDIGRILDKGIEQVANKYLAAEAGAEGYLVIFDTKSPVGSTCTPQVHHKDGKTVTSFTIGIGRHN